MNGGGGGGEEKGKGYYYLNLYSCSGDVIEPLFVTHSNAKNANI